MDHAWIFGAAVQSTFGGHKNRFCQRKKSWVAAIRFALGAARPLFFWFFAFLLLRLVTKDALHKIFARSLAAKCLNKPKFWPRRKQLLLTDFGSCNGACFCQNQRQQTHFTAFWAEICLSSSLCAGRGDRSIWGKCHCGSFHWMLMSTQQTDVYALDPGEGLVIWAPLDLDLSAKISKTLWGLILWKRKLKFTPIAHKVPSPGKVYSCIMGDDIEFYQDNVHGQNSCENTILAICRFDLCLNKRCICFQTDLYTLYTFERTEHSELWGMLSQCCAWWTDPPWARITTWTTWTFQWPKLMLLMLHTLLYYSVATSDMIMTGWLSSEVSSHSGTSNLHSLWVSICAIKLNIAIW